MTGSVLRCVLLNRLEKCQRVFGLQWARDFLLWFGLETFLSVIKLQPVTFMIGGQVTRLYISTCCWCYWATPGEGIRTGDKAVGAWTWPLTSVCLMLRMHGKMPPLAYMERCRYSPTRKDAATRLHGFVMEKLILSDLPYMHWNVNTVDTQSTTCFGTQEVAYCVSIVFTFQCL
jgi:hypothetical protein